MHNPGSMNKHLLGEKNLLLTLFATMNEGVVLVTPDGRIVEANPAAERILGLKRDEITSRTYIAPQWKIVRPDGTPMPPEEMAGPRAVREKRPVSNVVMGVERPDGALSWINVSAAPIFDSHQRLTGVVGTFTDITELKKSEEELRRIQRLESLGTLAGGIAHDFNNLLGGIFGYLTVARRKLDNAHPATATIDKALDVFDRARFLTDRILTFARGGAPIKKATCLEPMVKEAAALAFSGTAVSLKTEIPRDIQAVEADAAQLNQVFCNILINARQALSGKGTVTVIMRNILPGDAALPGCLPPGAYVETTITDNGPGIAPENLPKIFDPFFSTRPGGTGLGLAVCFSIIKAHGGCISADSKPGKGAIFKIVLPASRQPHQRELAGSAAPNIPAGTKVLLMDDEAFVLEIAEEFLSLAGIRPLSALNGEQAIELFSQARDAGAPFDIVVLDLTIAGGMSGVETLAKLRELDPAVKAIVCSGYFDDPVMAEPEKHGFVSALRKPYKPHQLIQALASALA